MDITELARYAIFGTFIVTVIVAFYVLVRQRIFIRDYKKAHADVVLDVALLKADMKELKQQKNEPK